MPNKPNKVILHCSATPDYALGSVPNDYGAKDIDEWHRKRGWSEIGYHAVIKRDGTIEHGTREEDEYGAHAKDANVDSLGVCYIGTSYPTPQQVRSIMSLYKKYNAKYGIGWARWLGHYEIPSGKQQGKTCPGFSMDVMRYTLRLYDKLSGLGWSDEEQIV